ncbi:MAG: VCBS repeat-containing protein [Thermoanaerobaculia bacterium]
MNKLMRWLAALVIVAVPQMLRAEAPIDFDGDGISDLTVYRNGAWWIQRSNTSSTSVSFFGLTADTTVPADYDGDGSTDRAIWRNGVFWTSRSTDGAVTVFPWGTSGDDPRVVADYDNDGKADYAIYRPSTGTYWIRRSSDQVTKIVKWGQSGDLPLPGNFVGSAHADYCVYRPSTNTYWVLDSQTLAVSVVPFGNAATDRFVAMDRVGTSSIDFSVFRSSGVDAGDWYWQSAQGVTAFEPAFGLAGDLPLPFVETFGGKSSLALVRNQGGQFRWYRRQNSGGSFSNVAWGLSTDVIPAYAFFTR